MYNVVFTTVFNEWLPKQSEEVFVEVGAAIEVLREYGYRLGRPHADTLKGSRYANMKELRVKTSNAEIRVAFAFDPERQAVILIAGDKRGVNERRFYRQLIAKADSLFEQYLESR